MPVLNDVLAGSLAQAVQVQQIIDALKGTPNKGVPVSLVSLNDSTNYALTVQNDDPTNSRALLVLKSDGTTLIEADATGVTLGSPVNLPAGSVNGSTALANASVSNSKLGPDVARANLLTNGGFEIWQRGNGPFTSNTAFTSDRWNSIINGSDTLSVSRDTANVDVGSNACAACTYTRGTGNNTLFQQTFKTSDGSMVPSTTYSLSVRVRTSTANAVQLTVYGDGSFTTVTSAYHSGSGTYQTLSVTFTTTATQTNVNFGVAFNTASSTAYIDNACLVIGSQPANYVPLHPADDLARCLRYYEKIGPNANYPQLSAYAAAGANFNAPLPWAAKKAIAPTITLNGTFAFVNASAAGMAGTPGVDGGAFGATATALGTAIVYSNNSGYITVEANP